MYNFKNPIDNPFMNRYVLRRSLLVGAATFGMGSLAPAFASGKNVKLAVGGRSAIYYLPVIVAEKKGFFVAQGLNVEVIDFAGGSKAMQALVGGSADICAGSFEHVVSMHAKGQPVEAVSVMGRYSGVVIALRAASGASYRTPASLVGMKLGVTAPGSGTHMFLKSWLTRNKVDPTLVPVIGVGSGAGAVAAMRQGELDGIAQIDPVISQLENTMPLKVLVDGRTTVGMDAAYGGAYAAATVCALPEYIAKNEATIQGFVNAIQEAIVWISNASPETIADLVPASFYSEKALYIAALRKNKGSFMPRIRMTNDVAANVYRSLAAFDPQVAAWSVVYEKTYTNRFLSVAKMVEKV